MKLPRDIGMKNGMDIERQKKKKKNEKQKKLQIERQKKKENAQRRNVNELKHGLHKLKKSVGIKKKKRPKKWLNVFVILDGLY